MERQAATIHDALWSTLPPPSPGEPAAVLSFEDHWLRRFGQMDVLRLETGGRYQGRRRIADEVWALVEGEVVIRMTDGRPESPSRGAIETHSLDVPSRVLVPFGVELRIEALRSSWLVRLMTHGEAEDPVLGAG
jgi:hypothetical protein